MDSLESLRLPPQAIEAETSVLGGLLLDNSALDKIADVLGDSDFYRDQHRILYRAIEAQICDNKPADAITLPEVLSDADLERVGGRHYIATLAVNCPSAANIRRYAEIVRERSIRRKLLTLLMESTEALYEPTGNAMSDLVGKLEQGLYALSTRRGSSGGRPLPEILTNVIVNIDRLYKSDGQILGLSTGFVDLDDRLSGLQGGDLIVIAGRPSMGKTALAMNIVEHAALGSGKTAAVFSLEMSDVQLVQRLLGGVAKVNQHVMRRGKLNDDDWNRMSIGIGKLNDAPIVIEETSYLTASELRARARRIARQCGNLGLIVVDYLQLMTTPGKNNRSEELGDITRALKTLAKELNVPVIVLSQLNRGLEQRTNKRPVMSDLRESGAIEQDADVILFIYREEVYVEDSPNKGQAEIIIGKQRSGPLGTVRLTFRADITRFENFAGEYVKATKRRSRAFEEPQRARADIDG